MLSGAHSPEQAAEVARHLHGMIGARVKTEIARAQAAGLSEVEAQKFIEGKIGKAPMEAFNALPTSIKQPLQAPTVGFVSKGHRFKGGDPSNKANWEPVK
jgi:hypothetical protein